MSDHIQKTIDDALAELRKRESSVVEMRRFVNQLCVFASREPMFPEEDLQLKSDVTGPLVKKHSYYGRPLATCVREYLTARLNSSEVREASLDDIFGALKEGSFDFRTLCKDEKDAKRVVAISLGKNVVFHRLPNGDFGLTDWYDLKKRRDRNGVDKLNNDEPSAEIDDKDEQSSVVDVADDPAVCEAGVIAELEPEGEHVSVGEQN